MAVATIDAHPERKKLLDMLLSGVSCREVARVAGLSHTAVANYKRKVVKPAMLTAVKLRTSQEVQPESVQQARETGELTRAVIAADPILARVAAIDADRARIKAAAEGKEDYRAWSALDRNDLSAIELHAKLTGRLVEHQAPTTQVVIVVPDRSQAQQPAAADDLEVIDLGPE